MLARREIPPEYQEWNHRWGAPLGRHRPAVGAVSRFGPSVRKLIRHDPRAVRARGPFAFQWNTSTRAVEYPWAYHQLAPLGPSRVLEIGGALSGLQFVLAKEGFEVHNVDPFVDYGSGDYGIAPEREHAELNRAFGTDVVLHRTTLPEAGLRGGFSAVYCISTIEHLSPEDVDATLRTARELLVPGGILVVTVDLFLNLEPFCSRTSNRWGVNMSLARIEEILGGPLVAGERAELCGYEEFSTDRILSRLEEFAVGAGYPQLAQLATFGTPGG